MSILIAYAFIGCIYWMWMAVGVVRLVRGVPVLAKSSPPEPPNWPTLSVVVPACNEADTLESAFVTILKQDYPNLQIVLVDDRSTDVTGAIADRLGASDRRVQTIHITELPDGWLGKVHALQRGLEQATGDWLLFTDADVHFCADVLRRAVAYCEHRRLDHLALMPELWWTRLIPHTAATVFLRQLCVYMRCWAIENPRSRTFMGVGAFNLVRRSAFERTEGFEWLRLEVADDAGLGLMLKRSGARCCIALATGLLGLRWYPTVAAMARGAEKGFAPLARCRLWRLLTACFCMAALELAPLLALVASIVRGYWALLPAAGVMLAAAVFSVALLAHWTKSRILPGLLFPLAALFNAAIMLRSGWLGLRRGGIVWRGTLYPSDVLRKGARVRLP